MDGTLPDGINAVGGLPPKREGRSSDSTPPIPFLTGAELDVLGHLLGGAAWVPDKPQALVYSQCVTLVKKGVLVEVEAMVLDRYWKGWRWGESVDDLTLHRYRVNWPVWERVKVAQSIPPDWKPDGRPQDLEEILLPGAPGVDAAEVQILKLFKQSGPAWVSDRAVGTIFVRCAGLVRKGALEKIEVAKVDKFLIGLRQDEGVGDVVLHRFRLTPLGEKFVAAALERPGAEHSTQA